MDYKRHGLSIGIERMNNNFFLTLRATGTLTHADYETINPMVDAALHGVKDPKVTVFMDASELEGWTIQAAWDDFRFGLKHGNDFDKIAIYGHEKWQENASKIGAWFISGDVKYFENAGEALSWLQE